MKKEKANTINHMIREHGITLIALVITIIVNRVFYDKNKNISNLVGFIL